jgi:hypothetical protein
MGDADGEGIDAVDAVLGVVVRPIATILRAGRRARRRCGPGWHGCDRLRCGGGPHESRELHERSSHASDDISWLCASHLLGHSRRPLLTPTRYRIIDRFVAEHREEHADQVEAERADPSSARP